MTDSGSSLVVWGSTGRRLQFSLQDLKMPEALREDPHAHFYEKQWDAVAAFWFNRVLKEASLQHREVPEIVEFIREDIAKRWDRRRQQHTMHQKRKRLLQGGGAAGEPAPVILITNVTPAHVYLEATENTREEFVASVVERVEGVTKEAVASWNVLIDDADGESPAKQKRKEIETSQEEDRKVTHGDGQVSDDDNFDDRIAIVCVLSSKEKAATAIAHLHGCRFDGRTVLCRFWS